MHTLNPPAYLSSCVLVTVRCVMCVILYPRVSYIVSPFDELDAKKEKLEGALTTGYKTTLSLSNPRWEVTYPCTVKPLRVRHP